MSGFRKATKKRKKIVMSIQGASGSGKTFSALNIAKHICPPDKRVLLIDTENSADIYSDTFDFDQPNDDDGKNPVFGPYGKLNYNPERWKKVLTEAAASGLFGVVVLDSLTHMWKGPGGILSSLDADAAAYKAKTGKFADTNALWKKYTPIYEDFMNNLRHLGMHVIFCLRAKEKTERKNNDKGKLEITKLGLEAEFREGFAYDIDAQFLIDEDHVCVAKKHRLREYLDEKVFVKPGKDLADVLLAALESGVTETPVSEPPPAPVGAFVPVPEEPVPATNPEPAPVSLPEAANETETVTVDAANALRDSLIARIGKAPDTNALSDLAKEANNAKKQGVLDPPAFKAVTEVYSARRKELNAA